MGSRTGVEWTRRREGKGIGNGERKENRRKGAGKMLQNYARKILYITIPY